MNLAPEWRRMCEENERFRAALISILALAPNPDEPPETLLDYAVEFARRALEQDGDQNA